MVKATYFDYALDRARDFHYLAQTAQTAYDIRDGSLSRLFDEQAWRGPAKETVKNEHSSKHKKKFEDFYTSLTEYRDKWLDSWLEAVDSYNYDVWQQTVQDLQQKLNTWNDEIWGGTWGESNLAEKSGLTILKTIDVIADHVPVLPELRIIVNDAEGLVPKPNKVAGDRKMWPQGPYDTFPSVFVEYSGTTDPTQAMTIHYTATPSHLY